MFNSYMCGEDAPSERPKINMDPAKHTFSAREESQPAASNKIKEPVATFSRAEIQQVRSSFFTTGSNKTPQQTSEFAQDSCAKNARGYLRARLEDIIVDPVWVNDVGTCPVAMSKWTVPNGLCHEILHVNELQGTHRVAVGTIQGHPSTKTLRRYSEHSINELDTPLSEYPERIPCAQVQTSS